MKNSIKLMAALVAVGFVSCDPEFDNPVDEAGFYDAGTADFSNYVAVGNSLTAGLADGALYITGQENSYPNIMAQQFAFVGGGEFTQPLMDDNLGGLLLGGTQITDNRLVLSFDADGTNPSPTVLEGTPTTDVATSATGPFINMGVPGAKSFHLSAPGYGNAAGITTGEANPYYARFATSASSTVIGDAVSLNPSFFSLWIGNNDILSYATSGGSGVDQTGNIDPFTYGSNDITDPGVFESFYNAQVEALSAGGAKGALVNLPDVTSLPYFTTVPAQSIPLDAATAGAVNAQFALYNGGLQQLAGAGIITAEEAALRTINFVAGVNFPIITDLDLTDVTNILIAQGVSPETAAVLGQLRQANATDLVVLPASSVLGTEAEPGNPLTVIGVAVPLANQFVLTETEQERVATANLAYNAVIEGLAASNDNLVMVDARSALATVATNGISFNGGVLTSQYVTGGGFSLDGVHPSPRGYAFAANLMINAINNEFEATIPTVDIGTYGTVTLTNNP